MRVRVTAKTAREEILGDIRGALHRKGKSGPLHGKPVPSASSELDQLVSAIKKDCEQRRGELIEQFESELTRVGGRFHRATTAESAFQYIEQVAWVRQAKRMIAWETKVIDDINLSRKLGEKGIEVLTETADREFIPAAAASDVGVSGVDFALADTGTLVLLARKGQARSISLLPPVHIAVVKPEQLLSGLSDLFPLLRGEAEAQGRDLSSAITFITGPSRTADIELTLVVGVHGPQQLHVVLLDC
jgi:L-lactate dehydrogenase complex protein LldG